MSTAINAQLTGTFTSDGTAVNLSLPSGYTEIELTNLTDIGSTAAATPVMKAWGTSSMTAGQGIYATKTNGAATIAISTTTATNGFTFLTDSGDQTPGAATAITGITNAAPPVASTASTAGLANGDIVRVYGTTGQLNIAGLDFTIGSVVANTSFALANMAAPGAAATAGFWRRIPFDSRFYPRNRVITKITQAASALVTMSVTHGFTVGQRVRLIVPSDYGMTQMDDQLATITAIGTADGDGATNTITLDVDSSAFTAFAFPSSATAAAGVSFAQVVPVGEAATAPYENLLDDATENQSITGVTIGTAVQTTAKVYQWVARKGQAI
jgi:hypothetical protein